MRLLWFNLATDSDDPVLGFTTSWIHAVAAHVEFMHVVTMRIGNVRVPGNVRVHSLGKERGFSEVRRAVEFYRILWNILRKDDIDVCFSHMVPVFTVMAAPVLQAARIPIVTWFVHPQRTAMLKAAHYVSARMVTSLPTTYPYRHDKLTVLSHGIDTALFTPSAVDAEENPPIILCVGRLTPIKNLRILLHAAAYVREIWSDPFRIVFLGNTATESDQSYRDILLAERKAAGLDAIVQFEPAVRHEALPGWYRRCAVHVNLTDTGSADKAPLEAMACGRPCVVTNEGYRETLGVHQHSLLVRPRDPRDLARTLIRLLTLRAAQRAEIGAYLRTQVEQLHSLGTLAGDLLRVLKASRNGFVTVTRRPA